MHKHEKHPLTGCRPAQLTGPWMMDAQTYEELYEQASRILESGQIEIVARESKEQAEQDATNPYDLDRDGVAHLSCTGLMTRYPTSMQSALGGTSTLLLQHGIRKAANDPDVKGIALHFASGGGCAEGITDTAAEIARARTMKPVHAHTNGQLGSAAYRLAIEADSITADPMASVGSVGCLVGVKDTSELLKRSGVKMIYAGSGDRKGLGAPGKEVSDQDKIDLQQAANDIGATFQEAVRARRPQISDENFQDIKRAGTYTGKSAHRMGLIDRVCTTEEAIENFKQSLSTGSRSLPVASPNPAAAQNRSVTMLTAAQIDQAKALPGCGDISAENADGKLLAAAMSLQDDLTTQKERADRFSLKYSESENKRLAVQTPPSVLKAMASASRIHMRSAVDKQAISNAVAETLASSLIGTDENLSATGLTPSATGECVASMVFSALAGNGPMPAVGKEAGGQPAPKLAPGAPSGEDVIGKARAEAQDYQKRQAQSRGLPVA